MEENKETYLAWKKGWVEKYGSLESAVLRAKELGGDEYAAKIELFIAEMEGRISELR